MASSYLERETLAGSMRAALNKTYVPLTDDAACYRAYAAAGIKAYHEADHERAVEYARLSRANIQNVRRQLEAA